MTAKKSVSAYGLPTDYTGIVFYTAATPGAVPLVSAVSHPVVDTEGGGDRLVVTVDNSAGCTGITAGGVALTSFAIDDPAHVSGVPGAHAAGIVDVVVTNAVGPSTTGTGLLEYWSPADEADCTLFAEAPDYVGATGVWTVRAGASNLTSVGANLPNDGAGAPDFDGSAYLTTTTLSTALVNDAGGTVAVVTRPTNINNPEDPTPYAQASHILSKSGSGPFGLYCATDGVTEWFAFYGLDDVAGGYVSAKATVSSLVNNRHAVIGTYLSGGAMATSANGSSFAAASTAILGDLNYEADPEPVSLGADYTTASLAFRGQTQVVAMFGAEKTDAFAAKFYAWSRQRHAVA